MTAYVYPWLFPSVRKNNGEFNDANKTWNQLNYNVIMEESIMTWWEATR